MVRVVSQIPQGYTRYLNSDVYFSPLALLFGKPYNKVASRRAGYAIFGDAVILKGGSSAQNSK